MRAALREHFGFETFRPLQEEIVSGIVSGRDTFVLRSDSGHDVVTDFDLSNPDLIMLDSQTGVYDGMLGSNWGPLWDGMQIVNSHGTFVATVHQADYNGDGITDTQFAMSSGATLTLLGVLAAQINGNSLYGG